jgi:hypothetical protein
MTLTDHGKQWLAYNAGNTDHCYVTMGLTYKDGDGMIHTNGSTQDVVNAFFVASPNFANTPDAIIIANTNYTQFKAINDNTDLNLNDGAWVYANDGHTGTTAFCYTCGIPVCSFVLS